MRGSAGVSAAECPRKEYEAVFIIFTDLTLREELGS
jgi:hypothetical protein